MTKDIDNTRQAIKDLNEDIQKWERVYNQLAKIDNIDIIFYQTHEKITELENLVFILKDHLRKMGGK